jgi:hypothetical protein
MIHSNSSRAFTTSACRHLFWEVALVACDQIVSFGSVGALEKSVVGGPGAPGHAPLETGLLGRTVSIFCKLPQTPNTIPASA